MNCPICLHRPAVTEGFDPPKTCLQCREWIIERMRNASMQRHKDHWTREYYWRAVWWRHQSWLDTCRATALEYAANQFRLHRDIESRTDHYRQKPEHLTDWQWMQT